MLEIVELKAERFKKEDDYNVINFTENTIILCKNCKLMHSLTEEILNTINQKAEYNDYWCNDEDIGKAKLILNFGLQQIIDVNGQRITLALEPSIIYKANKLEDIWLFDCTENSHPAKYEEFIYPAYIFKGSRDLWQKGKDTIYKAICNGQYGCYDGSWVTLKKEGEK